MKKNFKLVSVLILALVALLALAGCKPPDDGEESTIEMNKKDVSLVSVGATVQLSLTEGEKEISGEIVWKSDDEKVATVSTSGLVTATGTGRAAISATYEEVEYKSGIKVDADFRVELLNEEVKSLAYSGEIGDEIEYPTIELDTGDSVDLTYKYVKKNTTDKDKVIFETSDSTVATVSESGKLKAEGEGLTILTIKTEQTHDMFVVEGMSTVEKNVAATQSVIVTVGDDVTTAAMEKMFEGKHFSVIGYDYTGNFKWKGFENDLAGLAHRDNTLWTSDKLVEMDATVSLKLFRDSTFRMVLGDMPRAGWVSNVNTALPEGTIGEAQEKYGKAYKFNGSMFTSSFGGIIRVYGDKMYIIMLNKNATRGFEETIRYIGKTTDTQINDFVPIEFMNDLWDGLSYDLTRAEYAPD